MSLEITVIISVVALIVLNYLSVFAGLATLRWMDRRQKRVIADMFMRELGEKLETEANFQEIVKNIMKDQKGEPEGERRDEDN